MTPDVKLSGRKPDAGGESTGDGNADQDPANKSDLLDDEEDFFDFITRFQSKRMDDQRCSLADNRHEDPVPAPVPHQGQQGAAKEELLDMIAGAQSSRLNEQRAPWNLPGLNKSKQPEILQRLSVATTDKDSLPDDTFFEQLMKMQGTRIEDQRSSLPGVETHGVRPAGGVVPGVPMPAPTMPDEDFFSLICRLQGGRIDDQRASLPGGAWPDNRRNNINTNGLPNGDSAAKSSDI